MEHFQVKGFPTLLVVSAQGEKIHQLPIIFDPDKFIEQLNSIP